MDRLELISSKYGQEISKNLQMGFFGIYADVSEIPHGTFYGSIILLGGAKPGGGPKNPREMETHLRKTLSYFANDFYFTQLTYKGISRRVK